MYHASFFTTRLGRAAFASIAAMLGLNILALSQQFTATPSLHASSAAITGELA